MLVLDFIMGASSDILYADAFLSAVMHPDLPTRPCICDESAHWIYSSRSFADLGFSR